jgi:predicted HD phosphohydrolase
VVKYHGLFQTYYYAHHFGNDRNQRDKYQGHPHFQACVDFCEKYDQNAFDPNFDTMPLSAFEPMVRRIFARTPGFDMASRDVAA